MKANPRRHHDIMEGFEMGVTAGLLMAAELLAEHTDYGKEQIDRLCCAKLEEYQRRTEDESGSEERSGETEA